MTESEWLASTDPRTMLHWLIRAAAPHESRWGPRHPLATDRKLRLFACGCCRLVDRGNHDWVDRWEETGDPYGLIDVAWALRWAEVSPKDLPPATQADLLRDLFGNPFCPTSGLPAWGTWQGGLIPRLAEEAYRERSFDMQCPNCGGRGGWYDGDEGQWVGCKRCNGSGTIRPGGLLDTGRLTVLADALKEAGAGDVACMCSSGDYPGHEWTGIMPALWKTCTPCRGTGFVPNPMLAHLRSPGPHVCGCWAVDLLTGRV